jgi:hypothetical protein
MNGQKSPEILATDDIEYRRELFRSIRDIVWTCLRPAKESQEMEKVFSHGSPKYPK